MRCSLFLAACTLVACQHSTDIVELADLGAKELRVDAHEPTDQPGALDVSVTLARLSTLGEGIGWIDCPELRSGRTMYVNGIAMETLHLGGDEPAHLKGAELGEACTDPFFHVVLTREQIAGVADLEIEIGDETAEISFTAADYFVPLTLTARDPVVQAGGELALEIAPRTHRVDPSWSHLSVDLEYDDDAAAKTYSLGHERISARSDVGRIDVEFPIGIPAGAAALHVISTLSPSMVCSGIDTCTLLRFLDQTVRVTITR